MYKLKSIRLMQKVVITSHNLQHHIKLRDFLQLRDLQAVSREAADSNTMVAGLWLLTVPDNFTHL